MVAIEAKQVCVKVNYLTVEETNREKENGSPRKIKRMRERKKQTNKQKRSKRKADSKRMRRKRMNVRGTREERKQKIQQR